MKPIEWTREKPTKVGHYFVRGNHLDGVVYVTDVFPEDMCVLREGFQCRYPLDDPNAGFDKVEWLGPITPEMIIALYEALKRDRILVRYMDYPGWGDGLRISVGTDDQINVCLHRLKEIVVGRPP